MPNALLVFAAVTIVICSPALMLFGQGRPQQGDVALVISAPWGAGAANIAAMAGVPEVTPEYAPMGVLVMLETRQSVDRLYDHGAWLVISGRKVLQLCAN